MSYRVERAISGRAGCHATECKSAGDKIEKDALRFGTWVPFEDRGSWHWKHWGCVTGKQILNLRKYLEGPENTGSGEYRWDYLDGYEGEDKGSLEGHPDLQERVRRVITQGFIDPEDWNGDPEVNVLGSEGLRTKENKSKARKGKNARTKELLELEQKLAAVTAERDALAQETGREKSHEKLENQADALREEINAASDKKPTKKRGRAQDADGEEAEDAKPAKKKRATKAKKEADDEEEENGKPAKKSRAKKGVKKEEDEEEEDVKPARKPRAKKAVKKEEDVDMVKEEDEAEAPVTAPKKRAARGKKIKDEDTDMIKEEDENEATPITAPKKRIARGKKAIKNEEVEENGVSEVEEKAALAKKGGRKKAVKQEAIDEGTTMTLAEKASTVAPEIANNEDEEKDVLPPLVDEDTGVAVKDEENEAVEEEVVEPAKKMKGGKVKKAPAAKSTRASCSRTNSKQTEY